jgi:putative transcriptional regulator
MRRRKTESRAFSKLKTGLEDAIAYHRGRRVLTVREVTLPGPPRPMSPGEVAALRKAVHLSQAAFARILNVSTRTVQAWEVGARRPAAAALRLLQIARRHPEVLLAA